MLTAEDLVAHEKLAARLPLLNDEKLNDAYRQARRLYERLAFAGEDAARAETEVEIIARALADRAAGLAPRTD